MSLYEELNATLEQRRLQETVEHPKEWAWLMSLKEMRLVVALHFEENHPDWFRRLVLLRYEMLLLVILEQLCTRPIHVGKFYKIYPQTPCSERLFRERFVELLDDEDDPKALEELYEEMLEDQRCAYFTMLVGDRYAEIARIEEDTSMEGVRRLFDIWERCPVGLKPVLLSAMKDHLKDIRDITELEELYEASPSDLKADIAESYEDCAILCLREINDAKQARKIVLNRPPWTRYAIGEAMSKIRFFVAEK